MVFDELMPLRRQGRLGILSGLLFQTGAVRGRVVPRDMLWGFYSVILPFRAHRSSSDSSWHKPVGSATLHITGLLQDLDAVVMPCNAKKPRNLTRKMKMGEYYLRGKTSALTIAAISVLSS